MTATKTRLPITCGKYEPDQDGRRCRHYGGRGACALPDEFLCVEWQKANGHPAGPVPPPITRNFFGDPMPAEPPPPASPPLPSRPAAPGATTAPPTPAPPSAPAVPPRPQAPLPRKAPHAQVLLSVRDQDIASFRALGAEVRIFDEQVGEVWLVPAYTGQDRAELSIEHAALLAAICSAFPGANVTSFVRKPKATSPR